MVLGGATPTSNVAFCKTAITGVFIGGRSMDAHSADTHEAYIFHFKAHTK